MFKQSRYPSIRYLLHQSIELNKSLLPGRAQGVWAGAGVEDEQAPLEQQLHAEGDAAHEQAQAPQHPQVSVIIDTVPIG